MLTIAIPGREELILRHLILDFNGTIAEDGQLAEGVAERLQALSRSLSLYVVTADTHGTAAAACEGLPVEVLTYPTTDVGAIKRQVAEKLGEGVACMGNGFNDLQMAEACTSLSASLAERAAAEPWWLGRTWWLPLLSTGWICC